MHASQAASGWEDALEAIANLAGHEGHGRDLQGAGGGGRSSITRGVHRMHWHLLASAATAMPLLLGGRALGGIIGTKSAPLVAIHKRARKSFSWGTRWRSTHKVAQAALADDGLGSKSHVGCLRRVDCGIAAAKKLQWGRGWGCRLEASR